MLVGANSDSTGALYAGAAYLFSTNGTLLTTFLNPTPSVGDFFGNSVAAVGSDRVLIGAKWDNTGGSDAGAAYLFSTNGTLLTTFTNPTPEIGYDNFGIAVAVVGSNRVLIGAHQDDTGASDAGAANLFSLETFTEGLVADGVRPSSITTASLEDGAVTLAKLDPTIGVWTRSGNNIFRPVGNVGIGTIDPTNKLHVVGNVSATAFITTSDVNAKQDFKPVSATEVLEKVAALPIATWQFKEASTGRHMGPTAQDFAAAFGLGNTDTGIATVDADGVALAAIQGLNQKLEQKETEITELKGRLEKLEALLVRQGNPASR